MQTQQSRQFAIVGKGYRKIIPARDFREFTERTACRSRTETVRALRKGGAFFMEGANGQDYHAKANDFGRINVMLEALRNLNETGENCKYGLHLLFRDGSQLSYRNFPSDAARRELAARVAENLSEGNVILFAKG